MNKHNSKASNNSNNSIKNTIVVKYQSSKLSPTLATTIYYNFRILFDQEKIYRQQNICLKSIADQLQTNTLYLSQVVNESTGMNFQKLVNQYRIQEFQKRLLNGDAKQYTYFGLARDCGFNNRSTFYRAFKECTGMTPKIYLLNKMAA